MANNGILSKPPKQQVKELQQKLAGVTDPAQQARINTRIQFLNNKSGAGTKPAAGPRDPRVKALKDTAKQKLGNLTNGQNQLINDKQSADITLGGIANNKLSEVQKSMETPFDWNALPAQVVSGDYNKWRQDQIDSTYNDFSRRMDPQFKQEQDDFEQMAYERGWAPGSKIYDQQKQQLLQQQSDARDTALTQAQSIAGQNATQFFNVGSQAREQAYTDAARARGMSLADYMAITGAQSGMTAADLAHSQAMEQAQQQGDLTLRNIKATPHGGGGSQPAWQQYGFSSPMEYDAYQTQRARDQAQWEWQNGPQQAKGPSTGSQIAGAVGAGIAGAGASYLASMY